MSSNFVSGLVSGIDTAGLIDALVTSRSGSIVLLRQRQADRTAQLSAWKQFEATLLAFKVETEKVAKASLWDTPKVASSDDDILTASTGTGAALGAYDLFVESLAQAHQLRSDAYTSRNEPVGSGTLTIGIGGTSTDLAVTAGTTVEQLVQQINDADLGATASLVRSDNGTSESYYMVLTSDETGTANTISVTSGLTGGTDPAFTTETRAAANAVILVGGEGGLAVESTTNVFEDLLEDVDVTVHQVSESGTTATLSLTRDTEGLEKAVSQLVEGYNAVASFVRGQFTFDPAAGVRQPLMGDGTLSAIMGDVRSMMTEPLRGASGDLRTLFSIGIKSGANGTLSFDKAEFQEALKTDYDAVARLFRPDATFDAGGLEWLSAPEDLDLAGLGLDVEITQPATRAVLQGSTFNLGAGLVIDGTNNAFRVRIDGTTSETLTIAQGTYTSHAELASAIQTAIDSSSTLGELTLEVGSTDAGGGDGSLSFTSLLHGSERNIQLVQTGTSTFKGALGLTSVFGVEATGLDVEGTIGGIAGEGNGRTLRAPADAEGFGGVAFTVTADSPTTIRASFTDGIARTAARRVNALTDSSDGRLARVGESIQRMIDGFDRDIDTKQEQLDRYRERLQRRYARLEATLGQLQSQGAAVAAQFGGSSSGGFGTNNR